MKYILYGILGGAAGLVLGALLVFGTIITIGLTVLQAVS